MKLRTAIRKTGKWGGAGAVVLLVAVWVSSGWWIVGWWVSANARAELGAGCIQVTRFDLSREPDVLLFTEPLTGEWIKAGPVHAWAFRHVASAPNGWPRTWTVAPLWFPTLLVLVPTTLAWRADRRATRLARIGLCPVCGYDRRGLAANSVCPECGAAATPVISS